jgi:hypothetical protein
MNNAIIIDIETIPASSQSVRDYIAATIKPPKTMSVAATIEKWHKESKQGAIDDAVSMTGLDGAFGQVCVIGYDLHNTGEPDAVYGLNEADVLTRFNAVLDQIPRNMHSATTVVGHNVSGFDLRFLWQRYVVNGIRPHGIINMAAQAKSWDAKIYDTMTQFAGYGNRISLDKLCMALGIPSPKGDMDGSMVGQAVADGRLLEVVEYCKRDVRATREAYQRMTFAEADQMRLAA